MRKGITIKTKEKAKAAIELIEVDFEVLKSVTNPIEAAKDNSAKVWNDSNNNRVFDWENGDKEKVDKIFNSAELTSQVDLINNRVVVNSMEPRGAIGQFGFNGDCTFAIPIRSIFIKGKNGFIQTCGGIVHDSIPENELLEIERKLAAMKSVLESF